MTSDNTKEKGAKRYVPCTPAGTFMFDLTAKTRQGAIDKLLHAASHMPYGTWANFEKRGYEIVDFDRSEIP